MNLLTKDKYRTKIMQHVLHECDVDSLEHNDRFQNDKQIEDIENQESQRQKKYSRMLFEKVSKQKALISDTNDQCQRMIKKHSIKVSNDLTPFTHLHQEPYIYHQKLPIMSISHHQVHQIYNNKSKTTAKSTNNKQNNPKKSNHIDTSESKSNKKYRFISANKVAEVLRSKREHFEKQDIAENNQRNDENIQEDNDDFCQNDIPFSAQNQTQRSKGSQQMMDFLESARDKLFCHINSEQVISFDKDTSDGMLSNVSNQNQKFQPQDIQKCFEEKVASFKIDIEVSASKNIELNLNLQSDPEEISRQVILSNKHELLCFTDSQIKKLQELLSRKIQSEIEKQKKILKLQKNKKIENKQHKIVNRVEINEIIPNLKDKAIQIQQKNDRTFINKKTNILQNHKTNTQNPKLLQLSHIYIQKIDPPLIEESQPEVKHENCLKNFESQQNDPQFVKLVSFNPKADKKLIQSSQQQQISLEGYFNSPHQLITYRPEEQSGCTSHQDSEVQDFSKELKKHENISHFPLSASLSEFPQISKNLEINNQIGASKILSKSRSKLHTKLQKDICSQEQRNSNENVITKTNKQHLNQQSTPQTIVIQQFQKQQQQQHQNTIKQQQPITSTTVRSINSISSQIISRIGKENILNSIKEKQISKRQMILREKEARQRQEMKECSFRPKINCLSKSIDQNKKKKIRIQNLIGKDKLNQDQRSLNNCNFFQQNQQFLHLQPHQQATIRQKHNNSTPSTSPLQPPHTHQPRYQQLYANHKQIKSRKQSIRQKSLQLISFKPQINKISKKIIQTKRNSLNNSTCQQYYSLANSKTNASRHHSTCKKPKYQQEKKDFGMGGYDMCDNESRNLTNYRNNSNSNKRRKSLNFSRNLEGLQIGEYLYKQAMRMKKKKQSITQPKAQNFKPLQKSQQLVNKIKQKVLTECFYQLLNINDPTATNRSSQYQFLLRPQNISLQDDRFIHSHLRFLVPLLEQLQQLDVTLTREEFIQSGLKLICCLSQDQKAQFLAKKSPDNNKQNQHYKNEPQQQQKHINKLSQELIEKKQYHLQDIYHRGILYKKQIKEKMELDMESKVRKQLEKCTFKPKINNNFQVVQ